MGLSPAVLARADLKLSLSAMTFPHQLARLSYLSRFIVLLRLIMGKPIINNLPLKKSSPMKGTLFTSHLYTGRTCTVCSRSGPIEKIDNGIPVSCAIRST